MVQVGLQVRGHRGGLLRHQHHRLLEDHQHQVDQVVQQRLCQLVPLVAIKYKL